MDPEWFARMEYEPIISKGKKTVLYISITTTEHIDGIAEEELSNLIRTEVKYNERLNEAPTVMKFVMDCLCERGLWMKDGNKLYPFAINVSIEMYTNPVKCAFTHLVGDGVKLKIKTTQRPSLYLSEANKERLRDKLDWLTVTDLEDYGASTSSVRARRSLAPACAAGSRFCCRRRARVPFRCGAASIAGWSTTQPRATASS